MSHKTDLLAILNKIHNIVWFHFKGNTNRTDYVGGDIFIVGKLVHLIVGDAGSFFQILFLHVSVNKDVPQFLITNSHFESPLRAIWRWIQ